MPYQKITKDGIFGETSIYAPAGWEFDKTAVEVWWRLTQEVTDRLNVSGHPKPSRKLERFIDNRSQRIDALACVLSNSLGMASFFWVMEATKVARAEGKEPDENG